MDTDFYVLAELFKDYLGLVHAVKVSMGRRREIQPNIMSIMCAVHKEGTEIEM